MWFLAPPKTHPPTASYCGENSGLTSQAGTGEGQTAEPVSMEEHLCILTAAHKRTNKHVCTHANGLSIADWENQISFTT